MQASLPTPRPAGMPNGPYLFCTNSAEVAIADAGQALLPSRPRARGRRARVRQSRFPATPSLSGTSGCGQERHMDRVLRRACGPASRARSSGRWRCRNVAARRRWSGARPGGGDSSPGLGRHSPRGSRTPARRSLSRCSPQPAISAAGLRHRHQRRLPGARYRALAKKSGRRQPPGACHCRAERLVRAVMSWPSLTIVKENLLGAAR